MPEQFSLPGFDSAPKQRRLPHALFFAILPPAGAVPHIEHMAQALRQQHGLTGKPIRADRKHVTLITLGGYDEAVPTSLVDAASAVASALAMPRFEVVFDKALTFPGSGAFVLTSEEAATPITSFRKALSQALVHAGMRTHPIHAAHMTLAYDDRQIAAHAIEPLRWWAEDFVLILSLVGQTMHRHLGRWPLRT
jgi:RNA 2',3'-cyclic 3'-phosphodiesterase